MAMQPNSCLSTEVNYRIRHSTRARHLQICVSPWSGVEIVVPANCSQRRVSSFIVKYQQWINNAADRIRAARPFGTALDLPTEIILPAVGERWQVQYQASRSDRVRLQQLTGCRLQLWGGNLHANPTLCHNLLLGWLAQKGRKQLVPQLERLSEKTGLRYRHVQVRGQRTRWGSCSSGKTISINYKLLFLRPELVRYLLLHELTHLRYLNHSARYWALLRSFEPDCDRLDRELGMAWRDIPLWAGS